MMMWGRFAKNVRSSLYPVVALTSISCLVLAGLGFVLGWWQIELVQTEPDTLSAVANSGLQPSQKKQSVGQTNEAGSKDLPQENSEAAPSSSEQSKSTGAVAAKPNSADLAARRGSLRVSNQTEHPVRVALLTRVPKANSTQAAKSGSGAYASPAHWDFAPGEGSSRGLLLSLPNVNLKIKKGDVLVAFAQDGSRRYWGPYVVGETPSPSWSSQTAEWQLILQP